MLSHGAACGGGVAVCKPSGDLPVIGQDLPRLFRLHQVQGAQPVDMRALAPDHAMNLGQAGMAEQGGVEGQIQFFEGAGGLAPGLGLLHLDQLPKLVRQAIRQLSRQTRRYLHLDRAAQEMRLPGKAEVDAADRGAGLWMDIDKPIVPKPQQGVAQRGGADAIARRQFGPRQRAARQQVERQDADPQVFEDTV